MESFWWYLRCFIGLVYFMVVVIVAILSLYLGENVILFADRAELWEYWEFIRPWAIHVLLMAFSNNP